MKSHSYAVFEEVFKRDYYKEPQTIEKVEDEERETQFRQNSQDDNLDFGSLFEKVTPKRKLEI